MEGDWGNMINISNSDNYNNIKDTSGILKTSLDLYKSNSTKEKNSTFVDETSISSSARELLERDSDIKKFTSLALTDFDNMTEDNLRVEQLFSSLVSLSETDDFASELLADENFLKDLFGN